MASLEWYFVDLDGESKGPIATDDVKQLPSHLFVWNGSTVSEWTELSEIQHLLCALPLDGAAPRTNHKSMTLSALAQLTQHHESDEEVVDEPIEELHFDHHDAEIADNISDKANASKAVANVKLNSGANDNCKNANDKTANTNANEGDVKSEEEEEPSPVEQTSLQHERAGTMEISHTVNTVHISSRSHSNDHDHDNAVDSPLTNALPTSPPQLHSDFTDDDIAAIDGMPTLPASVELASPSALQVQAAHDAALQRSRGKYKHASYRKQKSSPSPALPDAAPEIRQSYTEPVHVVPSSSSSSSSHPQKAEPDIIACPVCTFHNANGAKKCLLCFTLLVNRHSFTPSSSLLATASPPQQRQRSNGLTRETHARRADGEEYETHHQSEQAGLKNTKKPKKRSPTKRTKQLSLMSVFSDRSTGTKKERKQKQTPKPQLQRVMSSTLHYQSESKAKAIAKSRGKRKHASQKAIRSLPNMHDHDHDAIQTSSAAVKLVAAEIISSDRCKANPHKMKMKTGKTHPILASITLLCAYDGYVARHGKPPHNATQLMKFSKTDARYKPLSFAAARKLLFDKNNKKTRKPIQAFWSVTSSAKKTAKVKQMKKEGTVAAAVHQTPSKSDKDVQSIWDVNENEDDDQTEGTYKKQHVLNGYAQHISAICAPTAESVMKDQLGIISPMTQRIKSVFDDSSTDDDDEQHGDDEKRLTVNMQDAKHTNVSSHFQQRL